jgi:hypothetical protein
MGARYITADGSTLANVIPGFYGCDRRLTKDRRRAEDYRQKDERSDTKHVALLTNSLPLKSEVRLALDKHEENTSKAANYVSDFGHTSEQPTNSARICQCLGCGHRLPLRMSEA